jgi:hypothetical protein
MPRETQAATEQPHVAALLPLCPISQQIRSDEVKQIKMSVKPYQSTLIPYEDEILSMRHQRPPMTYAEIAEVLRHRHHLNVCRETIFKFIKVRSRGRKVYAYARDVFSEKLATVVPIQKRKDTSPQEQQEPFFNYTPSDRYNLTRLPPEEAARRRKKLEEEGH